MSKELEERIAAAAVRQHGAVTHRQLLEAGLSSSGIARRVASGRLCRLHQGVYLAVPFALPRTLEMSAVLASGRGAVLSHGSADGLWALLRLTRATKEEPVEVTAVGKRRQRRGIRVHRVRTLPEGECTVLDGIPITTAARTLADLAAVTGPRELEAAVARAEREGLVRPAELAAIVASRRGRPGMAALRAVLDAPGGAALTRSAAEKEFLALVRSAGLPVPEVNVRFGRFEIDFLWRRAGIAVEVDGYRYHGSRARFEEDRCRDAQLLADGIAVLRLTWRQITGEPLATVARLAQALGRAQAKQR